MAMAHNPIAPVRSLANNSHLPSGDHPIMKFKLGCRTATVSCDHHCDPRQAPIRSCCRMLSAVGQVVADKSSSSGE